MSEREYLEKLIEEVEWRRAHTEHGLELQIEAIRLHREQIEVFKAINHAIRDLVAEIVLLRVSGGQG